MGTDLMLGSRFLGWLGGAAVGALLSMALPFPVFARVLVVDQLGNGDVLTFQAGVDSVAASFEAPTPIDSLIVKAGQFEETIEFPTPWASILVICSGADSTTVRAIGPALVTPLAEASDGEPGGHAPGQWIIRGLAVTDTTRTALRYLEFEDCVFRSLFFSAGTVARPPRFRRCEFRADAYLFGACGNLVDSCRFVGGTAHVTESDGYGCSPLIRACTFENPGDTAAVVFTLGDYDARLEDCTFARSKYGLVGGPFGGFNESVHVLRCRFEDITDVAILWDDAYYPTAPGIANALAVVDSRFDRCGRGVLWGRTAMPGIVLERDTLVACDSTAIEVGISMSADRWWLGEQRVVRDIVIDGAGGDGIVIHHADRDEPVGSIHASSVRGCVIRNVAGAGVSVRPESPPYVQTIAFVLTGNLIEGTGDVGVHLKAQHIEVAENLIIGSGGAGFLVEAWGGPSLIRLQRNTIAGSTGHGMAMIAPDGSETHLDVHHNLVALSTGDGLRVQGEYSGSIRANDAWLNYGAAFSGIAPNDSNLTVDPIFCDAAGSDFSLSSVSPCAPTGPYGQIGAHGVGCTRLEDAGPSGRLTASEPWPNPARGWVELKPPGSMSGWRIEIFDIHGRRVWQSVSASSGAAIRWTGKTDTGGSVGPGLYWVRFASVGGTTHVSRLVWLE